MFALAGGCAEGVYLWENGCEAVLYVGGNTPHGLSQSLFGECHVVLPLLIAYPFPPHTFVSTALTLE